MPRSLVLTTRPWPGAEQPHAIGSLTGYRALRWGRNLELIVTDQRSYRSEEPTDGPEADALSSKDFPEMMPEEAMEILDAGRTYNGGKPPASIRFREAEVPNFSRIARANDSGSRTKWDGSSSACETPQATWKIWGNTTATLDMRADPQNLPGRREQTHGREPGSQVLAAATTAAPTWNEAKFTSFSSDDHGITGFATVAGVWQHSLGRAVGKMAAAKIFPARRNCLRHRFHLRHPGMVEALEHVFPKDHPLRPLFVESIFAG